MEIRFQGDQVDRRDHLRRTHAEDRVEHVAAFGIRVLLQRESRGGPSTLEPEERTPDRRQRQQAVCRTDSDIAVQRVCRAGFIAVCGHGSEEVVLMPPPERPNPPL